MTQASNIPESEKWVAGSGWHLIEEQRVLDEDGIGLTKATGIKRDSDGFTMISEAGRFDLFEIFSCKRADIPEFRIDTTRRGPQPPEPPSDTYVVNISISDAPREVIYKYAKDIEAGLIAYPAMHMYNYLPAKYVKFDISEAFAKQHLVTAEEIQS